MQNIIAFFALAEISTPIGKDRYRFLPLLLLGSGTAQTFLYYTMQSFYTAFLVSFIVSVTAVLGWTYQLVAECGQSDPMKLRRGLWIGVLASFLGVAAPLWIFEMCYCEKLLPYILNSGLGGATFHIIWHIGAGTSSYLGTVLLTVIRIQKMGMEAQLRYFCGVLPYPVVRKTDKFS